MRGIGNESRRILLRGLRDGFPIGLGYFAVAFSLGITARSAGVSPLQGWIASILNHASAGEYALYSLIAANAAFWEVAAVIFVTNMRYLLMSASLSQKMPEEAGALKRLAAGFCITDEIFGLGIAWPGALNCLYLGTAFILADVMWATGTLCGILAGNVLPAEIVTALSAAGAEEPGGCRAGGRRLRLQFCRVPAAAGTVRRHPHGDPDDRAGRRGGGSLPRKG